ncbi:ribbon-helix-helix protein, CopG family [Sulfuriferula thiophila]|uniref:ribbon-helix-helix protein, CopG family n=1 Tax=Sulfuriferula thiophila TaxID=1781211 RepID=UPI000F61008F|nr:ribbon-helix-helix protein, CopG family [Sulfuriferula thiophila]
MATLNIRLPDSLDQQLTALAAQTHQNRSDLARTALEKYLREQAQERMMAEMVKAARFLATNAEARAESIAIAEEFQPLDNEALDHAEGYKPGDPEPEQWWK